MFVPTCCSYHICISVLVYTFSAVVDALKTLQEKIRRLELERKQAQKSYGQFSQDAWRRPEVTGSLAVHSQAVAGQPATGNSGKKGN